MTIKKSIYLLFLLSIISNSFNCSDEPTSIGGNLVGDDIINLKTISSDSLSQSLSIFHPTNISLAASGRLLLGVTDNINASILLKFAVGLADSIKNDIINNDATVTSAVMELHKTYSFGDTLSNLDFNIYKVTSNWSVNFSEDSIPQLQFDESLDLLDGDPDITDSITSAKLSNQLLQDWLHIAADTSLRGNYGIYIRPTANSQKVLGYQAITPTFTNIPVIKVVIEKLGAYTDTLTFSSTTDLTVMQGSIPSVSSGNIPIRAGYLINGKLTFDLSSLPENIVVNTAELVLTVDTLESKVGSSYTNSMQVYFLLDSTKTDSIASTSLTLSRSGNTFSGSITTYVRAWLQNNNNQGLVLSPGDPISGVELFVIKGSDAVQNKPLLKITYTKLK